MFEAFFAQARGVVAFVGGESFAVGEVVAHFAAGEHGIGGGVEADDFSAEAAGRCEDFGEVLIAEPCDPFVGDGCVGEVGGDGVGVHDGLSLQGGWGRFARRRTWFGGLQLFVVRG